MRVATFVLLMSLAVPLPAQASKPKSDERRAVDLINRASSRVMTTKSCRREPPRATFTHDAPSADLLATLAVLRRPATAEDTPAEGAFGFLPANDVYADYIRVAHAAEGRTYWIVAARDALHFAPIPQPCMHRIHQRLRRLARSETPRVRRRALYFYNQMARNNRELATRPPREGVFVFERSGSGVRGGGGGGGVSFLREYGEFGTSGTNDSSALVTGLIPDGVATVTSTFGTTYSRGAGRKPRRYAKPITRTDPVQDNIVSFEVARSAEDAFPAKMIWRDADGNVVKVVREPS